jgi:GNAT superfamily N-acetyltransferase
MHWLCKPSPQFRTHHLHLVPYQSPLWFDRIAFRDYLQTNSTDASEYAQLKKALAEKHRFDREAYTDAKGPFIRRILKLALAREQHYDLRRPQTTEEWIQYHAIRRRVLWKRRGRYGVYDENHPDESLAGRYPLLFFHQGEAIGVIRVDIEGSKAIFRRVAIKEESQRSGHGRVLLGLSEKFATENGCDHFYSFVSPDAVEFYEKCGFQRDPLEAGASGHVPMQKFVRR